jgi:hypothetical protein
VVIDELPWLLESDQTLEGALRRARGDPAVIDAKHRSRTRPYQCDIIHSMATLQVHDLGRATRDPPQETALRARQRRARLRLSEQFVVLANVLLGRRFPSGPIRSRYWVHSAMLMAGAAPVK